MSIAGKVDRLPPEVRAMVQRELVLSGFGGYAELAEKLQAMGYRISRSTLHRYGQEFRERIRQLEAIKALTG